MKIVILTWYYAFNYGARAHSYALYKIIQEMGHECVMIAYHPSYAIQSNIDVSFGFSNRKRHPILVLRSLNRCRKLSNDEKRFCKTRTVKSASEIDALGLDAIILGSDEVFNLQHPCFSKIYYGVGIINTPCFSYAPSAGQVSADTVLNPEIINSLRHMKAISVRDENTKKLIENNIACKVKIVSDPTLLYDFSDIRKSFPVKNYLLIYAFDVYNDYRKQIEDYAKNNGMKIVSLLNRISWADYSMDMADFETWVSAFHNAKIVVTDSFHGLVFSIKSKKDFVIIKRGDKVNKIDRLLEQLGIVKPYYKGESIEGYIREKIDYKRVEERLDRIKCDSIEYIKSSLAKVKG